MRPGFWSDAARLFLLAYGRQDLVDRGDALAQRVSALMLAAHKRLGEYLAGDDLYDGRAGADSVPALSEPATAGPELASLEEFVNVRLRQEIEALESVLAVFDDLGARPYPAGISALCDSLRTSFSKIPEVLSVAEGLGPDGVPCVILLTASDPGRGGHGLRLYGHPMVVRQGPAAVRRIAACKVR